MNKQFMLLIVTGMLCGLATLATGAGERSLQARYEPHEVTVTGMVSLVVFPGPPNYESIETGDTPEPALILHLDLPIDVVGDEVPVGVQREGWLNYGTYTNLVRIHLVDVNHRLELAGTGQVLRVRATGTLMEGHTGHHRAEVVLFAPSIEEVP